MTSHDAGNRHPPGDGKGAASSPLAHAVADRFVDAGQVPNVYTLVDRDGEVGRHFCGWADVERKIPIQRDSIFRRTTRPGEPAAGTYGWPGGFGTEWLNDPANRTITLLFTQRMAAGQMTSLYQDWMAAVYSPRAGRKNTEMQG